MASLRLTSKRQATFPRALCEELRLKPGDTVTVEPRVVDDERVWVLRREEPDVPAWFGCLERYARGKSHSMNAIRKSMAEARKHGEH